MSIWRSVESADALNASSDGTLIRHLGIVFTEVGVDFVRATMPVDERTRQPYGLLHGGASVVLAETADFFMRQQQRFEGEAKAGSDELEKFSTKTAVYSADDQKQLLLKRVSDLGAALAVSRGLVSQKAGERQTLAEELRKLAPVARSPYVSSLVDQLGGDRAARAPDARALDERSADPPLLLVKVYQDSMVELFKINSDLVGAQSLERAQAEEMANLAAELNTLAENEQRFDALKRSIDRATYNADVYSKRMVEEQINAESSAARFSSVKVMQRATVPLRPVSPNYVVFTLAAAAASALAGLGAALLRARGG